MNLVLENRNYRVETRADALNHRDFLCEYLGHLKALKQEWIDLDFSKKDIKKMNTRIKNVENAIVFIDEYLKKIKI